MTMFSELVQRRARLQVCADQIRSALDDMHAYREQGTTYAGYAGAWAAVMMATGILRTGLSTVDKRAALLFSAVDRGIDRADRAISFFTHHHRVTKSDLMASLDPNLRPAATFVKDVRDAQAVLGKVKVNPPKHLKLVLELALGMTEDTLLLLQAGQLQHQVTAHANAALRAGTHRWRNILRTISLLDAQIADVLARRDLYNRTA